MMGEIKANESFRSGYAVILGRPNVGKSTLMNHLIGQKIAITSRKPQTTRGRIETVLTTKEGQVIFLDTPGMLRKAGNKLGEYLIDVSRSTLDDADVVLFDEDVRIRAVFHKGRRVAG